MNLNILFQENEVPTIEEYLKRCGVENYNHYINPPANAVESYTKYDNMDNAVYYLKRAIDLADTYNQIILVCDCDCDGYCATTIAYQFLINQGVSTHDIIILFHDKKQHGLSMDILQQINTILLEDTNVVLIWVPDAGTNDADACAYYECCYGIPVLITDHHEASVANDYATIVNNQTSTNVTNKNLCGAGVTHKVITAYCKKYGGNFHQNVLDLVALATIGDVMDMRNIENRMIVKWGLSHITNPFLGVMCDNFISDSETTPTTLAWNVIPKINAVCRSSDMDLKTEIFDAFAMDFYSPDLVNRIIECHTKQRNETNRLYEKALKVKPIGDNVKIFEFENTPYTGLIATKLVDHYGCPCMVVHQNYNGEFTGSLRSPCPMRSKLQSSGLMTICAGHEQSCGVGWKTKDTEQLSSFCRQLDLTPTPKTVMYSTDSVLMPSNIFTIVEEGKELWGHGIDEPTIHISGVIINGKNIKELGTNKTTIKFLYGDIEFIMFFCSAEKKERMNVGKDIMMEMEIIGTPTINTFKDKDTKQIIIKDWEIK